MVPGANTLCSEQINLASNEEEKTILGCWRGNKIYLLPACQTVQASLYLLHKKKKD
jgi:hypothetical protein